MARILRRTITDYNRFIEKYLPDFMKSVVTDVIIQKCPPEKMDHLISEMKKYDFSENENPDKIPGMWFTRNE